MSEWFGTWFDSDYYHLLYKDRDFTEAENFVEKLATHLKPNTDDLILDLALSEGFKVIEAFDFFKKYEFNHNELAADCIHFHNRLGPEAIVRRILKEIN